MFPLKMQHNNVVWQKHKKMGTREGKEWRRVVQRHELRERENGQETREKQHSIYSLVFFTLCNIGPPLKKAQSNYFHRNILLYTVELCKYCNLPV